MKMIKKCGPECVHCGCGRGEGPCNFKEAKLNALRKRGLLTEPVVSKISQKDKRKAIKSKRKAIKAKRKKGRK